MPLLGMELGQVDILLHLFHLLLGDMLRSPTGAQTFQQGTDHINILHVLPRNAGDIGTLVRNDLDQSLQFQLTECLSDGGSADAHLLADRHFLQFFMFLVFSA